MRAGCEDEDMDDIVSDPSTFLLRLKADPGFPQLEDIEQLVQGFLLDIGVTNAEHPSEDLVESMNDLDRDYCAVIRFLEFDIREATARPPYPENVPRFRSPAEMIDHFKKRYEGCKEHHC